MAEVPWTRHDKAFSRAQDLVVRQAIVANKAAAAQRYAIWWRAMNTACVRVATEALERADLLEGPVAVAIDEVKSKRASVTSRWCATTSAAGSSGPRRVAPRSRRLLLRRLSDERGAQLAFVTCDGAEWIRSVVNERAPEATMCLDTFHVVSWATDALNKVRRAEWNSLRQAG